MSKFALVARHGHSLFVLPPTTRLCHWRREAALVRRWATGHVVQWNLDAIYSRLSTLRQLLDQPHLKRLVRGTACPWKRLWDVSQCTSAPGPKQAVISRFATVSLACWCHSRTNIVCHGIYASPQTHVDRATLARQHVAHRGPLQHLCHWAGLPTSVLIGILCRPSYQLISLSRA